LQNQCKKTQAQICQRIFWAHLEIQSEKRGEASEVNEKWRRKTSTTIFKIARKPTKAKKGRKGKQLKPGKERASEQSEVALLSVCIEPLALSARARRKDTQLRCVSSITRPLAL
jgi:hypothetical protein